MSDMNKKISNFCLMVLAMVAIVIVLIYTKKILVPFVIAVFIYFIISPLFNQLEFRHKVPKSISMIIVILMFLVASFFIVFIITNSIDTFIKSADDYKEKIISFIEWGEALAIKHEIHIGKISIKNEIKKLPLFSMFQKFSGGMLAVIGNSFLIMIFVIFMIFGEKESSPSTPILIEIKQKISKYIITKIFLSLATGLFITILLLLCGVDLAIMFGILTVFLNFIPNIGSIIANILPLPVVLLQFGFSWQLYTVLIISAIIQITIGSILEPKIMGERLDLHPITVLLFLMFWGLVWGIPGMFLAVPITSILKIIFSRIEGTKFISELFAGRIA